MLSITLFFDSWNNLNLEHDLTVSVAINASVRATDVAHEMKVIRLKTFADSLVDQGHWDRKLRYKIHAHPFWTQLGYEIAVHIENELLPDGVARVAVFGIDYLCLD